MEKTSEAIRQARSLKSRGVHRTSVDIPLPVFEQLKILAGKKGKQWNVSKLVAQLCASYVNVAAKNQSRAKQGEGHGADYGFNSGDVRG
jgi:predicted DNA-binding ribbon-helix-helix protein